MSQIREAVEPRRTAAIERAKDYARVFVAACMSQLEDAGWDLQVAAPYPSGSMGRRQYKMAKAKRETLQCLIYDAKPSGWRKWNDPHIVARSAEKCLAFVEDAGRQASEAFDAYIVKLTAKVGQEPAVVSASLDDGALWVFSHLTVTRIDGAVEKWRTQMIVNVSVLGKVFNQWPTRKVAK